MPCPQKLKSYSGFPFWRSKMAGVRHDPLSRRYRASRQEKTGQRLRNHRSRSSPVFRALEEGQNGPSRHRRETPAANERAAAQKESGSCILATSPSGTNWKSWTNIVAPRTQAAETAVGGVNKPFAQL